MCGIALLSNQSQQIDPSAIQRMTDALLHRGPDAQGVERANGCFLGHTRLQVIDPTGGVQPMWDDTGRYCLVFNGEIFNFQSLRSELQQAGVQFHTRSDTEVVLLAYRHWGPDFLHKINGQFAFAIWDTQTQSVFAARDRLGENPLFWALTPSRELIIASELKSLLAADLIRPEIDLGSVDSFLKLIYVPPNRTIYQNIHTLPAGHQLTYASRKVTTCSYWQPSLATTSIDDVEAGREIRRLLDQSVQRQMVADTDVGAFLSGGLDSTSIVALMSQNTSASRIKTFAVGFGDLIDELPFARDVADCYQTEHAELQMNIDVGMLLEKMASVYDQPFGDSSNIPTYLVSEFASKHVKVVLSGDGGDELFGGYSWYNPLLQQANTSTRSDQMLAWWGLSRVSLGKMRRNAKSNYRAIRDRRRPAAIWQQHLDALSIQSAAHRQQLWQRDLTNSAEQILQEFYSPLKEYSANGDAIDQAVDFDLRCYLPGDIFSKVDSASMAHGLETRSPFMDVDLVEFVLSLPARLRFASNAKSKTTDAPWQADKGMLRSACEDLWPKSIVNRKKQGFGAPVNQWLQRSDVKHQMQHVLRSNGPLLSLLPGLATQPMAANNPEQAQWNILCLGLWLEEHEQCLNHLKSAS